MSVTKMKEGDYVIMFSLPDEDYANTYCSSNGLKLGVVCRLYSFGYESFYCIVETNDGLHVNLGTHFLIKHFKKYLRDENLNAILDNRRLS